MKYEEIVAVHRAFVEMNPEHAIPSLRELGIREPKGTRRVRRKMMLHLRNLTPEAVAARLTEAMRRTGPLRNPSQPAWKWAASHIGLPISVT